MNKISITNKEDLITNNIMQIASENKSILAKVCNNAGELDYGIVLQEPTADKLINKIGVESVRTILKGSLIILNAKLNIKHKMDELQVELFINDLLDVCKEKDYRLEELVYFFNEVGKSKYGKIYERLDGALLFEFLAEYEKQSAKAVEDFFEQRNKAMAMGLNPMDKTNEGLAMGLNPLSKESLRMLEETKQMLIEKNKKPFYKPFNTGLKELSGNVNNYIEQQKGYKMIKDIAAWDGKVIES